MIVAVNKDEISADVAARLVAAQFPQWAGLPVTPVALNGWDHTTFRLGDELSLRLPNSDGCVPQVAKEQRWLPVLARHLPLPIPEPVAMGRPGDGFPRPWSVYRWIAGEPASAGQVADPAGFARGLAGFLGALQAIDTSGGPPAGRHNFFRGGPLAQWDEQTRQLIRLAAGDIDARAATSVWETALASRWEQAPMWVHGDLGSRPRLGTLEGTRQPRRGKRGWRRRGGCGPPHYRQHHRRPRPHGRRLSRRRLGRRRL
jgi:aminoglycoside phosphotransferase (APT) family kinase protein